MAIRKPITFLLVALSISNFAWGGDWWEPAGYDSPDDEITEIVGWQFSVEKTQKLKLKTFQIQKKEPQLGPFTLEDILSDLPKKGHYEEITWYVEEQKFLVLGELRIKHGSIQDGLIIFGELECFGTKYQAGDRIFSFVANDDKENEYPY